MSLNNANIIHRMIQSMAKALGAYYFQKADNELAGDVTRVRELFERTARYADLDAKAMGETSFLDLLEVVEDNGGEKWEQYLMIYREFCRLFKTKDEWNSDRMWRAIIYDTSPLIRAIVVISYGGELNFRYVNVQQAKSRMGGRAKAREAVEHHREVRQSRRQRSRQSMQKRSLRTQARQRLHSGRSR